MKIEIGRKTQTIIAILIMIGVVSALSEYGNNINIPGNFTGLNGIFSGDISANDITVSGTVDGVDIASSINQGVRTTDSPTFNNIIVSGNVDGVDISASINQGVRTTDSPTFSSLNATDINADKIGGVIYADQYATVSDAINASVIGDQIYFSKGTYQTNTEIIPKNHSRITCASRDFPGSTGTIIQATSTMSSLFNMTNSVDVTIENCKIDATNNANYAINLNRTTSGSHQNTFTNLYLYGGLVATADSSNSEDNVWDNVIFDGGNISNYGMFVSDIGGQINIRKSLFENAKISQINYTGSQTLAISDTVFTGNAPEPSRANIVFGGLAIMSCSACWFEHNSISPYINGTARNIILVRPYIDGDNTTNVPTITGTISILTTAGGLITNPASTQNINITGQLINIGTEIDVATASTDYFGVDSTGNMVLSGGTIETQVDGTIILKKTQDQLKFQIPGQPEYMWMAKPADSKAFAVYNATSTEFVFYVNADKSININGTRQFGKRATAPTADGAGDTYFDTDVNYYCFYNSTAWVDMNTGLVTCS